VAVAEARTVARDRPARRLNGRWAGRLVPYWFILPALLVLAAFIAYPVGYSFWLSFRDYQWNMPALGKPFVGLRNYADLPADRDLVASVAWTTTPASIIGSRKTPRRKPRARPSRGELSRSAKPSPSISPTGTEIAAKAVVQATEATRSRSAGRSA
jgi:hypothetical protein